MKIYYEGTDITEYADATACIHKDTAGGQSDLLDITLENARKWYSWKPKKDDRIEITHDGYSTGRMYLNTILPEDGRYRILATSTPSCGYVREWRGYQNKTLGELMEICAAECGLEYALHGIDSGILYPFILRKYEGVAAFLQRLSMMEGAKLKISNGRINIVSIQYAQEYAPIQTISIDTKQRGVRHTVRADKRYKSLTIKTPDTEKTAQDRDAQTTNVLTLTDAPARNVQEMLRWASGLLLYENRQAETLEMETDFSPAMTAMQRIDIESITDAKGQWLIEDAEHDLINGRTTVKMARCLYGIG